VSTDGELTSQSSTRAPAVSTEVEAV